MSKRTKILERLLHFPRPGERNNVGTIHPLGYVYLEKKYGQCKYWTFGYEGSWYSVRGNPRTHRWDLLGRLNEIRPCPRTTRGGKLCPNDLYYRGICTRRGLEN